MAAQKHKSNNIFTNRDVIHQHLQHNMEHSNEQQYYQQPQN